MIKYITAEDAENASAFAVAILSTACIVSNYTIITTTTSCIFYYCIFDMIFFKKRVDMIIHHCLVISMYYNIWFYSFTSEDTLYLEKRIILAEISNFFLMTKIIISQKKIGVGALVKNCVDALFVSTFFYFRVYYYYDQLLKDDNFQNRMVTVYSRNYMDALSMNTSIYGFFALNVYWSALILKKILPAIIPF